MIGQTDFSLARDDAKASVLLEPSAIARTGKQLFVADAGHNRVLVWNTLPAANGAPADFVLGQGELHVRRRQRRRADRNARQRADRADDVVPERRRGRRRRAGRQ